MASDEASKDNQAGIRKEKIRGFIKVFPVVGEFFAWIYEHWGRTGLLSTIAGLLVGVGLIYFGVAPKWLVADVYKANGKQVIARVKPTNLTLNTIKEPKPDWLQPYADWLETEAENKRNELTRVGTGAVISAPLPATQRFRWVLKASPGFDLNGRAFKVRSDGYFRVIEPVRDGHSIYFNVSECDEGERLVGLFLATWQGSQPQLDISDTFHSSVGEDVSNQ